MMNMLRTKARSLLRKDDGAVTVDFAIMIPIYIGIFLASAELGVMTMRYAFMERALDMSVRDVRLSTGYTPTETDLVQSICDNAAVIPNCTENLSLQMFRRDPRDWQDVPHAATCGTLSGDNETIDPVVRFDNGDANDLMFLRACVSVDAIFPGALFLPVALKGDSGEYALVVENAFVQEPR